MSHYWFFLPVVIFYAIIYFLDMIFKSCMLFPYVRFLHNTGLDLRPFAICWETTRLNRPFMRYCGILSSWSRRWFQFGAFMVSASVIPALCLLFVPVFQFMAYDDSIPILVPIIPGLNLPYSQILYYTLSIFVCVIFHELGHALASSREKVPIEGFGISIVGIFPLAHVRISKEDIKQMHVSQQLRIYSAGIWHNLVLAAFALALVAVNPYILKPLYQQGNGVTVIDVAQGSGLGQKGGLEKDDAIIGINECLVQTEKGWRDCIHQQFALVQSGFCVDETFYKKEDISIKTNGTDCCPKTSKHMCFGIGKNDSIDIDIQPARYLVKQNLGNLMCLPARKFAEDAKMCWQNIDCYKEVCLIPLLNSDSSRFLRIRLTSGKTVFYIGQLEEIFSSVAVSPWVSKYVSVSYIDKYEILLGYIFSFSCGLGILNTIPLFWLDGKYIIECIIHGYLKTFISNVLYRHRLVFAFKVAGSIGLSLSMLVAFAKSM